MQKAILLIALFAISGFAMSSQFEELNLLWSTWKSLHGKSYTTGEDSARYAIFVDNYNKITKHNAGTSTFKMGLNKFADLTAAEFKAKMGGCARVEDDHEIIAENTYIDFSVMDPPATWDWRPKGAVTGVKNQGDCGSCWTFSTTGTLEGWFFLNNGTLLSFSEQQIVDCATQAGAGCQGGTPYLAVKYAAQFGLEQEDNYPYVAKTHKDCNYSQTLATMTNGGYSFVPNYNADALKNAITVVPTSIVVEADQDVFQLYKSGVIGPNDGCGDNLDHAVLAVGWDQTQGSDAFIVKNSWGTDWGMSGYLYISTDGTANGGAGVCGILSQPVVPRK